MSTTVLIADDHPSFRASARAILEADGTVAASTYLGGTADEDGPGPEGERPLVFIPGLGSYLQFWRDQLDIVWHDWQPPTTSPWRGVMNGTVRAVEDEQVGGHVAGMERSHGRRKGWKRLDCGFGRGCIGVARNRYGQRLYRAALRRWTPAARARGHARYTSPHVSS